MTEDRRPAEEVTFEVPDDDVFDARDHGIEDYVTFGVFWILAFDVFLQFFSRYVLGNSIAWTEEMARYLLVMVGFLGSAMAVRTCSHISVEFFYRYMPGVVGRIMSTLVDLVSIAFYLAMSWLTLKLANQTTSMMVSVDIPKSLLYYLVLCGFVLMTLRAIQATIRHWREGTSELMFTDDKR